jgi:endoglucanase
VATYGQSPTEEAVNDLVVPSDDNIIVSVHSYDPYNFALNGNSDVAQFNDSDKAGLDAMFDRLKSVFISKGIPVLIDECGNIDKDNQSEREEHLEYFISAAKQRGIKCFYWDNGEYKTGAKTENTFAIFNRKDLSWNEGLVKAMMKGAS